MKKVFLFATLAIGLYSCNGGASKAGGNADSGKKAETATPAAAEASLVGKWHVIDMQMKTQPNQVVTKPEEIKASVMKDSMMFEFTADGNAISTSKSLPASKGKYTKNGNMVDMTSEKGKKESFEILTLTDKGMTMKIKGEKAGGDDDMTFVFEKM